MKIKAKFNLVKFDSTLFKQLDTIKINILNVELAETIWLGFKKSLTWATARENMGRHMLAYKAVIIKNNVSEI